MKRKLPFSSTKAHWPISPPVGIRLDSDFAKKPTNIGLSLHQGNLPFIVLNGINITFSPFLLIFIASTGVLSLLSSQEVSQTLFLPFLFFTAVIFQLIGLLIFGYISRSIPSSLILSLSGVIDPALVVAKQPPTAEEIKPNDSEPKTVEATKKSKDNTPPIRALGASFGAISFFILSLSLSKYLFSAQNEFSTILEHIYWIYCLLLIVCPFLAPHHLINSYGQKIYKIAFVITITLILCLITLNSFPVHFSGTEAMFCLVAVFLRIFWWSRVTKLGQIARRITLSSAMVSIDKLQIFSHGETLFSAQKVALQCPQEIFPIVSGSNLCGYVEKDTLLRMPSIDGEDSFISDAAHKLIHCTDGTATLDDTFSPNFPLPAFIIQDNEITGIITDRQVRDALLIAFSGHPRFPE